MNVGTGTDVTISHLAETIATVFEWDGDFVYDASMPDGTPRKLLDVSLMQTRGWDTRIDIRSRIAATYEEFLSVDVHRILTPSDQPPT